MSKIRVNVTVKGYFEFGEEDSIAFAKMSDEDKIKEFKEMSEATIKLLSDETENGFTGEVTFKEEK